MKIFISYVQKDKNFASKLAKALQSAGIETWIDEFDLRVGGYLIQKITEGIKQCDYIIAVLSRNYTRSEWARRELDAFAMKEVASNINTIIPVLIEDCEIPIFLSDKVYADFRTDFDEPVRKLIEALQNKDRSRKETKVSRAITKDRKESSIQYQTKRLKEHLRAGELTLVCGAGVSIAAGVPTWPVLLKDLLSNLFGRKLEHANHSHNVREKLAELYQEYFNPSPLVIAQYLKNGLGNDFLTYIRNSLYGSSPSNSNIIDAIIELCRPQRSRQSLNSIITFNFDDLIEHNLGQNHIKFQPIFAEGQKALRSELPIYHVHGYLPRDGSITPLHEIVFSEDAYHSQFIDPFSWANLTQLTHFSQNICIFIGLSMTDPNLRRLLDVSMRKNPNRKANHYIFKKRYSPDEVRERFSTLEIGGDDFENAADFMRIAEVLEETDANNLGMNVIWIDAYDEIPSFLRGLSEEL